MHVLISGASGLIGKRLTAHLREQGHRVSLLVRRTATSSDEISWDPVKGEFDIARLAGVDAVINLSGAGVGDQRWSTAYKKIILESRVRSTSTIAEALAKADSGPRVLINASAIGFYGNRGNEIISETSAKGSGFLSDVVADWEAAAKPAIDAGIRVTFIRTGLVVAKTGGAFQRMLPLFRFGLGGTMGSGKQFWPLISLTDEVRAIEFLLTHDIRGAVNLTSPESSTNRDVTRALARVLRRPAIVPVPAFALKLVLGEFSTEILDGADVRPIVLKEAGFTWLHPTIESAMRAELL